MSRPAAHIYAFLSPTDNQLLAFLEEANALPETIDFSVQLAPGRKQTIDFENQSISEKLEKAGKGRQILQASFSTALKQPRGSTATFTFERGRTENNLVVPSTQIAELFFRSPENNPAVSEAVARLVEKHFKRELPQSVAGKGPDFGIFVTQLAEISTGIADNLASAQIAAEQRTQEHLDKIQKRAEQSQLEFDAECEAFKQALSAQKNELDEREQQLNNARARSERRELRKSITSTLRDRLENEQSPRSAKFARYPIVSVAVVGLAFSLYFAFFSFEQFTQLIAQVSEIERGMIGSDSATYATAVNWLFASLLLRGSIGLGAATFFGFYLIRYFKNLEETAHRRALDLERYLFDIDRASWVIETVMELKEEEEISSAPEPWLKGVTHNLFGFDSPSAEDGPNALEALGDILASGAKLKVGSDGGELELQPKASKQIAKNRSVSTS